MSVTYLDPSNPGASTQAQRDAAATANWNAIKAAAAASTTGSPVSIGVAGASQGIVRLNPGIWFLSGTNPCTPANGFDNVRIHPAPGATIWRSDGVAGECFTLTGGVRNCSIKAGPWADDGHGAAPNTMSNKVGGGLPGISAGLGGGDPDGPSVTANGDPRVPWNQPVSEMCAVMVDKDHSSWINNHCGFVLAQECYDCEMDRQFYFGYVNATSSGMAMLVPRAGSKGTPLGSKSPHNLHQTNQFMINAPQGFGLNQWTDCRGFYVENLYCAGGEAMRMETHVPKDGGIHDGSGMLIAQAGGNVGVAFTAHNSDNGVVRLEFVWSHSSESGAVKVRQGVTGGTGSFAVGSYVRNVTAIGGDKTWAQLQGDDNTPTQPKRALLLDAPTSWRGNVDFQGDIAFGDMDHITTTGGIPVNTTPGVADGFSVANASSGIRATTRDLTGPHPDGTEPPPDTDIDHQGAITPHGAHTFVGTTPTIGDLTGRAGVITPHGAHAFAVVDIHLNPPTWERTPDDPSTNQAAFFRARLQGGQSGTWRWRIDDEPLVIGQPASELDYRTFPVSPGEHTVTVDVVLSDGSLTLPQTFTWLVPRIEIPAPFPDDLLGCGSYTVYICNRGGGKPLFSIPFTNLDWERVEAATGQASLQVDGISNYGEDCCQRLNEIQPWKHEGRIYRDSRSIWAGPVVQRTIDGEQAKLVFRDLSAWAGRRRIGKSLAHTQIDLAMIARDYWVDGMSRDKTPNIRFQTYLTGILADRAVEADKAKVDAQVAELVRSGLSWSVIARTIVLGIRQGQTQAVSRLLDSAFIQEPGTDEDGSAQTNDLIVLGEGSGDGAEQPHGQARDQASVVTYGLLEDVIQESEIKDDASADANARTQVALLADPPATISGGTLSQIAPVTIDELIAGAPVDIRLNQTCVPVAGIYRMVKISGSASADGSESIKLDVELISNG